MAVSTSAREVSDRFAGGAIKSINASTANGAHQAWDLRGGYTQFSMQITGLSTAGKVLLEGSLNGSNWVTLGSTAGYTSTAGTITRSTNAAPVQFVRLNIVAHASTGNVTGWIGVA